MSIDNFGYEIVEKKQTKTLFDGLDDESSDSDEDDPLENDYYFQIDPKNSFSIDDTSKRKEKLSDILYDNEEALSKNHESKESILSLFYEKLYPKCNRDPYDICFFISNRLLKNQYIRKISLEEKIKYFISVKNEFKYSKKIVFNQKIIQDLGLILCHAYSKFKQLKINNTNDLINNIKKVYSEKIDVMADYYLDYNEGIDITKYWQKNQKKYILPCYFIFLMNIFNYTNTIEIDINFDGKSLTTDERDLFLLSLLNIPHIFYGGNTHIKINLINEKLQCDVYRRFFKKYKNSLKKVHETVKKDYLYNEDLYKKKWDFTTEFLLEEHRNFHKIISKNTKKTDNNIDNHTKKDTIILSSKERESFLDNPNKFRSSHGRNFLLNNNMNNTNTTLNKFPSSNAINFSNLSLNNNSPLANATTDMEMSLTLTKDKQFNKLLMQYYNININNNIDIEQNPNLIVSENDIEIINKNIRELELILLIINSLISITNVKILDLVINDCYKSEMQLFLANFCPIALKQLINFNILDILIEELKYVQSLNIETNVLDDSTFSKIISIIEKSKLSSLKISFFTSDVTYLQQTIYKIYKQNTKQEIIKNNMSNPLSNMLDYILPSFVTNLEVLFQLLIKKDCEIIGVNFDTPNIISTKDSYMNTILKFIMNLLFMVDNHKSRIKKLIILSPYTILDSRNFPSIENVLGDINFNAKNQSLKELSLHLKLFHIINIKNVITIRLISLNIGDCDIDTFQEITKFLTSYDFCKSSSLRKMSLSLLPSIISYNKKIRYLIYKIFGIKIRQLIELNIYTNLFIDKENYLKSLDIFRNNWIKNCRLTLNKKSDIFWKVYQEQQKKILFLVSHSLEEQILNNKELMLKKNIFDNDKKDNVDIDKKDEIYWMLKYLFNFRYTNNSQNYITKKQCIFSILKFLYFTKTVDIKYQLESDDKKND